MILVIFGNVPLPFTRLAKKVEEIAEKSNEKFIVQHGHTNYLFINVQPYKFFSSRKMAKLIKEASFIISHGGYGTISECLKMQKKLIAVPRKQGIEHNHSQEELVRALEANGCILGVYDIEDLESKLSLARRFKPYPLKKGNGSKVINEFIQRIYSSNHNGKD